MILTKLDINSQTTKYSSIFCIIRRWFAGGGSDVELQFFNDLGCIIYRPGLSMIY